MRGYATNVALQNTAGRTDATGLQREAMDTLCPSCGDTCHDRTTYTLRSFYGGEAGGLGGAARYAAFVAGEAKTERNLKTAACHAEALGLQVGNYCVLPRSGLPRRNLKNAACQTQIVRLQDRGFWYSSSIMPPKLARWELCCSWIRPAAPKLEECSLPDPNCKIARSGFLVLFVDHACPA